MTQSISPDQLDRLRSDARRLSRQATTNENDLLSLLTEAQTSRPTIEAVRHLCVKAREHSIGAERLVADLGDSEPIDPGTPMRRNAVLVADDHQDTREWLARVLRQAGFVVGTATNGLEAILAAYQLQPTVIVMDMLMPVLNGIESARLIKAIDELRSACLIAHSTAALFELTRHHDAEHLFTEVLTKPASQETVIATVQRCALMENPGAGKAPGSEDRRG